MRTEPVTFHRAKKAFTRRRDDVSQQVRLASQVGFGLIALGVGVQFYLWVRYYETGGASMKVARPDGVEAWLPIAALMNLKSFILTGAVPDAHAAGMFMLIAFLAISLLFRKSFCSWICPVGTISEWLWQTGQSWFTRAVAPPRWLDVPLRGLKYMRLADGPGIRGRDPVRRRRGVRHVERRLAHGAARPRVLRSHPARIAVRASAVAAGRS